MTYAVLAIVLGLVLLIGGGELLVSHAVKLAAKARVAPLFIGLVLVGFGTSAPELVASIEAVRAGAPAIAWGNIVGSNIANTLLVLGGASLVAPIRVAAAGRMRDPVVGLFAALLLCGVAVAGLSGLALGLALVALLLVYIAYCFKAERTPPPHDSAVPDMVPQGWFRPLAGAAAGLALLIFGGRILVDGATDLARLAGMSETLIGLTIVAVGTSLPELVASLAAARKGESEVALGSVTGSNLYNILFIGGTTMALSGEPVPVELWPFDLVVMAASAAVLTMLVYWKKGLPRWCAAMFLLAYAGFLAMLAAGG
ncbi:calcium/sodium antiporter [Croceicoccus sp. YJ47]|uniref:calcium/sodium antiporter n=1 Tax=Croceicoccus sp. YJ47 TaxID=2798724 RepID=UPI0019207568|nr:calcium/sodium antiporter [Croceicoccus sp. YJ47]QQN74453.1 calcium/sodium antiporter [Croceicoccus sp. YJ47]